MVQNNATFSASLLAANFSPENLINISIEDTYQSVVVDSRKCTPGSIFVALLGENSDGHDYVDTAFINGAAVAIVEKRWYAEKKEMFPNQQFIIVDNTYRALQALATQHRLRFKIPVIAVAGSNGKTSTKEMLATVLSQKFNVLRTHANYNNQLGVPLTMLAINETHEVAVLEIGTNMPGEIDLLSRTVMPTHGIITNIGKEHLELLEDLDGVENEETALFAWLYGRGTAFINLDDERLKKYIMTQDNYVSYGTDKEAQISGQYCFEVGSMQPTISVNYNEQRVVTTLNTYGLHSALNAIAATAIAFVIGLSADEIKAGLNDFVPVQIGEYARMALENVAGITIINDCYNANPSSTVGALENLEMINSSGQKIAVLGGMLEIGASSPAEHKAIVEKALGIADKIFLFDKEFTEAVAEYKNEKIEYFEDKELLAKKLIDTINAGDIILVKGSRGKKMEEIIGYLKKNLDI